MTVKIFCHPNNRAGGATPREPAVQIIGADEDGVQSITFTPDEAEAIAAAIINAARAAKADRKIDAVEI